MKKVLVIGWLTIIIIAIGAIFWYSEWVYHLPTPVPVNYKPVAQGTTIKLNNKLKTISGKPLFIHFFNPDCPCSRFNIGAFKLLVKQYGNRVNFAIVVLNNSYYTERAIQDKFDLNIPVFFDPSIARACGVYSTPQAVLIDANDHLYYRGNYNSSRYCTDERTSYAKIALGGLLNDHKSLVFDKFALTAYGCRLPNCTN